MAEQNIVEIGYDPKFQPEIDAVTKSLIEQYTIIKKIDETKISPGSGGGFAELKAQVDALAKSNKALMDSNVKMAQSLADLNGKQAESISVSKQAVVVNQQVAGSMDGTIKKLNDAKSALAANTALQKQLTDDMKRGRISADEYRAEMTRLTSVGLKYKQVVSELTKDLKDQTRVTLGLITPYELLSKKYNDAAKNAQNLAVQYGVGSMQAKAATATANGLHNQLLTIDQTIGKSQRNVGNYAGGIQKAFGGLRTLANVLPGLGLSGIFLLGYEAVKKLVESIGGLNNKVFTLNEQRKLSVQIGEDAAKSAGKEQASLLSLKSAIESESVPREQRLQSIKNLKKEFPGLFDGLTNEELLTGKVGDAYNKATEAILRKARASAASAELEKVAAEKFEILRKIEEDRIATNEKAAKQKAGESTDMEGNTIKFSAEQNKRAVIMQYNERAKAAQDEINQLNKKQTFLLKFVTEGVKETTKIETAKANQSKDLTDKTAEEILKINYEMNKRDIQRQIDEAKATVDNDKERYRVRLEALGEYNAAKIAMIELDRQFEIGNEKLKYDEIKANLKKQAEDDKKKDGGPDADFQREVNTQLQREKEAHLLRLLNLESKYYDELRKQGKSYLADIKKLEDEREKNAQDAFKKDIDNQAANIKSKRAMLDAFDEERRQKRLKEIAAEKEKEKLIFDFAKEFANKALDLVSTLVNAGYTRQQNALQALIDANTEYGNAETERIANSTVSEQEKAAKIITLNATVAAKNKQLAQEQKELDIKKAQFDKQVGIAKIIMNTAIGVTSALAGDPYTAALRAAIVAALGAAELAIAIATPIPTYAEGTENHPGGYAITGEGKYAEMVTEPGKKPYVVDRATLSNLPAGTKIKPLTGDYINEQMYGSMITSMAERMALADAIENKRSQTDWQIARYLASELKQQPQRKQPIQVVNKIDMGFAAYINKQIFGKG